jgi:reductive dehalogenase
MFIHERSRNRPVHLGPFPLETLARRPGQIRAESERAPLPGIRSSPAPAGGLGRAARIYFDLFMQYREARVAPALAPVPGDLNRRSADIKGGIYFLNAAHAGICRVPARAWITGRAVPEHDYAIVIVVEHGRVPEPGNAARAWLEADIGETGLTRAAGIAVNVANYCGLLGYAACAHAGPLTDVDIERLAVLAGVCCRGADGVVSPYLEDRISLAAVTTAYPLACDLPLAPVRRAGAGWRYWWGINGAESGRERNRRARRATHQSAYPMEDITRVDRPTTLILDDEVPRVPQRANFFERARLGDLGPRAARERIRFSVKNPNAMAYARLIRGMQPLQDGAVREVATAAYSEPAANARALKSLAYALGADLAGICEIPRYAWYSHRIDGTPVSPYHRFAVVLLIDQGFETMEGASGDDWISGSQSMRAYMRGSEIAGIMAEFLRGIGFPARSHTSIDSDVLHIPLILWAGLGELSRIGELVLNPYVGPRFKSVVLTTDMPLAADRPIDFGLQQFCSRCLKCARECPCDAIPVGAPVMFNGYEMWKIDAERCTRYRVTNARGAGCGRCMKTCPLNKVPNADGALLHRAANWLGVHARRLKPLLAPVAAYLDDRLGYGRINPVKKWWLDLEIVNGVAVAPAAGTNRRDIDYRHQPDRRREKIVYYHASLMPPPERMDPCPVDRRRAQQAAGLVETPAAARARKAAGGPKPQHYVPAAAAAAPHQESG